MTSGLIQFGPEELAAIWPEIILAGAGCLLVLLDAFAPRSRGLFATLSLAAIAGSLAMLLKAPAGASFGGRLETSALTSLMGVFIGVTAAVSILVAKNYLRRTGEERGEFYALLLWGHVGVSLLTRGLDLLVIDYIQLLQGSSHRAQQGRVQEVTEITTSLKALAKELNVPIVALSQLSRQVENRDDKRPQLSDLRESGSIEQDADVVMFVYREEYYMKTKKPDENDPAQVSELAKWLEKMERVHNRAEILVEKHRHGPTNRIELFFDENFTRFSNLAAEDRAALTR